MSKMATVLVKRGFVERGWPRFKRTFLIFVASLVALHPIAVKAAETLGWDDCVLEAARANPDLHVAESHLKSARYQVKSAWSGFFPQLSANLGYSFGSSSTNFATLPGSVPNTTATGGGGTDSFYSASVSASENIFAGFSDKAKIKQAQANREVARTGVDSARAQLSFDLESSFAGLLYAQKALKLTQDIIRRREEDRNMIQLRYENGRENKGSLLLSKAYWEQARYDELQAKDDIKVSRRQLAKVLGRDETADIRIVGAVPISTPPAIQDLKSLAHLSPDYQKAMAEKKAAKAAVTAARSPFFPSLNVTATAGKQGSDWPPQNGRWSVGSNLSFPFFSGGKDYYATKSATASLEAATYNEESIGRQVTTKLEQALTGFVEAVQKLRTDQSFLDAATVREEIARRQYENGLLSFQDWDIIENDLIARQKQVLQSQRDRIINEAAWEQSQGKGVFR